MKSKWVKKKEHNIIQKKHKHEKHMQLDDETNRHIN